MRLDGKLKQRAVLAVLMTLTLYVIANTVTFIHEMAHGGTAVALGGYFPFIHINADGGRIVYLFPAGAPAWKEALVLLAGPTANFLIALASLALIAVGVKSRGLRLLTIFTGGVSALALINGTGLLPPWRLNDKEIGQALNLFNAPPGYQVLIKTVWLLMAVTLAASLFRLFFRELAAFFPSSSYRERFVLVTLGLGVPVLVFLAALGTAFLSSGYGEGVLIVKQHTPHIIVLILGWLMFPLLIGTTAPAEGRRPFIIPRWQFITCLTGAAILAMIQPIVFGNDRANPAGLFLGNRPPEVSVSACNVSVILRENYRARVRLLLRPFVREHNFLWERVKGVEPESWQYYEEFARQNLPTILGTDRFEIVSRYADSQAPFFNANWSQGARIVEAEVDLSDLPRVKGQESIRLLTMTDFWRKKGQGYIDFTEIRLEGNLRVKGFKVRPDGANSPTLEPDNVLRWENTDFATSFVSGSVAIQ